MRANTIRILLADSQQMFLDGLVAMFSKDPNWQVVATSTDSSKAFFQIVEQVPDVIIMDVELAGRGAFTVAEEVASRFPATKIVFLTGFESDVLVEQALRLDVAGYLLKSDSFTQLVANLRAILQGEKRYSERVFDRLEFDSTQQEFQVKSTTYLSGLTSRQLEVLRHLVRGESVKEVAKAMMLSERAIESHKYRIMQKLGIHDRVELTRFAIREGLTIP
ncbi:MAG: response regulator transcription factor [Planctomycetaceae bacterium]|nr:response regulator transcription factor [Planctomycetaceae bacterium]